MTKLPTPEGPPEQKGESKVGGLASQLRAVDPTLRDVAAAPTTKELLEPVRAKVCEYWPAHWLLVEAQLAACATLRLKNVGQSLALFAIGRSGSGKSTCLYMFGVPEREMLVLGLAKMRPLVEELDNFTLASFLSHFEGKERAALEEQALYRRLRHRVLLTSDLARFLRGNVTRLTDMFGLLIRVLDGEGLRTDSGVHGSLGAKGEYSFVWLAGTTPFRQETWRTMAQLGPRLLFFWVRDSADTVPDHKYAQARGECRDLIFPLLQSWMGSQRQLPWPTATPEMTKELRRLSALAAAGQTLRCNTEEEEILRPSSGHFRMRLTVLASGRAALYGRSTLDASDLPMIRHIVQSSMYAFRGPVLVALHEGIRTVSDIREYAAIAFGRVADESTIRKTLDALQSMRIVRWTGGRWELTEQEELV
jgi:hypothetical protein